MKNNIYFMDLSNIREFIENQFCDDYEEIKQFMDDVNDTLKKLGISNIYETYNEFCMDIEKHIFKILEESNIQTETITTELIIIALNNMVKYKILEDENYEEKIKNYFSDPDSMIEDINKTKIKNSNKN